jgi:hypothetical protein
MELKSKINRLRNFVRDLTIDLKWWKKEGILKDTAIEIMQTREWRWKTMKN